MISLWRKKKRRLNEIIELQRKHSLERNKWDIGKIHNVLIEGTSKRSNDYLQGRNTANKVIIFPAGNLKKGTYVNVKVHECTAATLKGEVV